MFVSYRPNSEDRAVARPATVVAVVVVDGQEGGAGRWRERRMQDM